MPYAALLALLAVVQAGAGQTGATQAEQLRAAVQTVTEGDLFAGDARAARTSALDRVAGDLAGLRLLIAQKQLDADLALAEASRQEASAGNAIGAQAQYKVDLSNALSRYQSAAQAAEGARATESAGVRAQQDQGASATFAALQAGVASAAQRAGVTAPSRGPAVLLAGGGSIAGGLAPSGGGGQSVQVAGEHGERLTLRYSDGGLVQLIRTGDSLSVRTLATGTYPKPITQRIFFDDGLIVDVTRQGAYASAKVLAAGAPAGSVYAGPEGYPYYSGTGGYSYAAAGTTAAAPGGQSVQVLDDRGERVYVEGPDGSYTQVTLSGGRVEVRQLRPPTHAMPWQAFVDFSDGTRVEVRGSAAGVTASPVAPSPPGADRRIAVRGEAGQRPEPALDPPPSIGVPSSSPPPTFLDDPNGAVAAIARFEQQVAAHRLAYLNGRIAALERADRDIAAALSLSAAQRPPALAGAIEALRLAGQSLHDDYRAKVELGVRDLDALVAQAQALP